MADAAHPNPALPGGGYIDPTPTHAPHAHVPHAPHGGHAHSAHVAHHFETAEQQFDSSKLGMWLFLATEVLLFGGLFCAYAVWRGNHPELFIYGHHHLDKTMGAVNTVVLLLSSFTMAWAVTAAQRGNQLALKVGLFLTLLGGAGFMYIKFWEYKAKIDHGLLWGKYYAPTHEETDAHATAVVGPEMHAPAPVGGQGAPAISTPTPPYSQEQIQHDRVQAEAAPATIAPLGSHSLEPPAGGSPTGTAASAPSSGLPPGAAEHAGGGPPEHSSSGPRPGAAAELGAPHGNPPTIDAPPNAGNAPPGSEVIATNWIPTGVTQPALKQLNYEPTKILVAAASPAGLKPVVPMREPDPKTVRTFFSIYFCMTGLHGLHVLAGMGVIGWLLFRSFKGAFGPDYFTPVDLGGLYWHLVDLIWIYLFPLLYLIH